jgi:hypothetical protein
LIGWLAVIEGAGRAGPVDADADEHAFRLAIGNVNQRLRSALGERP